MDFNLLQAKAALYRRKQLQSVFEKRNQALINIQTMKLQLAQAKTDSKVDQIFVIYLFIFLLYMPRMSN